MSTLISSILWACDPSKPSPLVLRYVQELAAWSGADVWLIFVSTVPEETLTLFRRRLLPPEQLQQTVEALRDEAVDPLAEVARDLVRTGLAVRTRVITGSSVGEGLLEAAEQCRADLIVMGSGQKSLLQRLFSATDTETVLRQASVPVLVVPVAAETAMAPEPAEPEDPAADPQDR